jgi:hypothetical protein
VCWNVPLIIFHTVQSPLLLVYVGWLEFGEVSEMETSGKNHFRKTEMFTVAALLCDRAVVLVVLAFTTNPCRLSSRRSEEVPLEGMD